MNHVNIQGFFVCGTFDSFMNIMVFCNSDAFYITVQGCESFHLISDIFRSRPADRNGTGSPDISEHPAALMDDPQQKFQWQL